MIAKTAKEQQMPVSVATTTLELEDSCIVSLAKVILYPTILSGSAQRRLSPPRSILQIKCYQITAYCICIAAREDKSMTSLIKNDIKRMKTLCA